MLVLSRKLGEKVVIDGNITVSVVDIKGNKIRLAFDAPDEVCILRAELLADAADERDADLVDKPLEWQAVPAGR